MVLLSHEALKLLEKPCGHFLHPGTNSCIFGLIQNLGFASIGSIKFCTALAVLQIAAKNRRLTKKSLVQIVKYNVNLLCCAQCIAAICFSTFCIQRRLFGKFHYYSLATVPGSLSAAGIFILPSNKRYLFVSAIWCSALETILSCFEKKYLFRKPILFMIFNSLLMYYLTLWKTKRKPEPALELWFFSPNPGKQKDKSEHPCNCIQSCVKCILKEASTYFWYGALLEAVRITIFKAKMFIENPKCISKFLLKKSNLRLAGFPSSYVLLYKITNCVLCRLLGTNNPSNSFVAGFVSGFAFFIRPSITINITLFVNLVHISWKYHNLNDKIMKDFPINELLFMLIFGYLLHKRVFDSKNCSKFYTSMISIAMNGRAEKLLNTFNGLM